MTRKKTVPIEDAFKVSHGSCSNCKHWDPNEVRDMGLCRRYPAQLIVVEDEVDAYWPVTMQEDFCGEHHGNV